MSRRTNPSEHHHLTADPIWLPRPPIRDGLYAIVNGLAFEITANAHFGYHIDRIDQNGYYLGETIWVESYGAIRPTLANWYGREESTKWHEDDYLGDDDGVISAKGQAEVARRAARKHKRINKKEEAA